jgi:hypothetical protein
MKKLLLAGGAGLWQLSTALMIVGLTCFLAPTLHAQASSYSVTFVGLDVTSADLSTYIGLDRKLKTSVPGQSLVITVSPPLTKPQQVRLTLVVSASGSSVTECNRVIATAVTVPFTISGGGRTLGASDFTGTGGVGVQTSDTYQPCIDALSDKIQKGGSSMPYGIYTVSATLNDASTNAVLKTESKPITIQSASVVEAILNLTSPSNGDQISQSPSIVFSFENSIPGRLLVFEHSTLSQSPDDATRDDNSPLKMVDLDVTKTGAPQITATYPGTALRSWTGGRKYSWYFRGASTSTTGSTDVRKSPIWSFTVLSNDPNLTRLVNALSAAPDPVSSTYTNLANSGFTLNLTGTFYLQEGDNGTPQRQSLDQILSLLADLARHNVAIKASVVSQ